MEDEDDIWDYKSSVGKRKSKKHGSGQTNNASQLDADKSKPGQQRKKAKKTKRGTTFKKMEKEPVITIEDAGTPEKQTQTKSQKTASASKSSGKKSAIKSSQTPVRKIHEGFCPVCQMPFRILPLSPSWHVRECMESPNAEEECPDGASCDNTMESHYKEYAHQTLAMIRSTAEFSPTDENGTCKNGTKILHVFKMLREP
ncbi:hypothetical protein FSP39_001742 [Pinctada imbricata]|uniref:Uncharacterized protein n=1 Tax=Pinctada imbricata TaxID=66713 RepID=A0AA88Y8R4_PINIB|nr:hypothetical protein FSP39_001742 [Pinctada imbricata]